MSERHPRSIFGLGLVFALASSVFACGGCGEENTGSDDAGADAGQAEDGGGGDDGGDGGPVQTPCDLSQQNCPAGQSCLRTEVSGQSAAVCFPGACDLVTQNCPMGQKCTYLPGDGGMARGCAPEGAALEGEPCNPSATSNTCKAGLACTTRALSDGGSEASCVRFCNKDSDCGANKGCYISLIFEGSSEMPLACGDTCRLLEQNCPKPEEGCYPSSANGDGRCFSTGAQPTSGACTFANDCRKGSLCVKLDAGAECRELCAYATGSPSCAMGSCSPLSIADAGYCG